MKKLLNSIDSKIIPIKDAIEKTNCGIKEFSNFASNNNATLLVVPKDPFHIGIRFPKSYRKSFFDHPGENPLEFDIQEADGFTINPTDIPKVLQSLDWRVSEPQEIAFFSPEKDSIILHTPYSLSKTKNSHEGKCPPQCVCGIDDKRLAYKNQEFYFKNKTLRSTKIKLDDCFLICFKSNDILESYFEASEPDFTELGGYQKNEWSNHLICDVNAIYYHLKNKKCNNEKEAVKSWVEKRWKGKKGATKAVFRQISTIVTDKNFKIDHKALGITEKEINRNQTDATDILILIDAVAEKRAEDPYKYLGSDKFHGELKKLGLEKHEFRQAIYSIIKAK